MSKEGVTEFGEWASLYSLSFLAVSCEESAQWWSYWNGKGGLTWLHTAQREGPHIRREMEKWTLAQAFDLVVMKSKCNDLMWLKQQNHKGSAGTFAVWKLTENGSQRHYFVSNGSNIFSKTFIIRHHSWNEAQEKETNSPSAANFYAIFLVSTLTQPQDGTWLSKE